ncbi:MAG: hypothetical protein JWO08_3385 [Verrucomicrobiaceae bacterium]|nr:hypothetical protein [Verrucomicrobiaceae bacterium]
MTHPHILRKTVLGSLAVLALAGIGMTRNRLTEIPFAELALAIITVQIVFWMWKRER